MKSLYALSALLLFGLQSANAQGLNSSTPPAN